MIRDAKYRAKLPFRARGHAELVDRIGGIFAEIDARLAGRESVRVLELGCGYGTVLLELGQRYGPRVERTRREPRAPRRQRRHLPAQRPRARPHRAGRSDHASDADDRLRRRRRRPALPRRQLRRRLQPGRVALLRQQDRRAARGEPRAARRRHREDRRGGAAPRPARGVSAARRDLGRGPARPVPRLRGALRHGRSSRRSKANICASARPRTSARISSSCSRLELAELHKGWNGVKCVYRRAR